jgi:hypothetical protein
MMDTENSTAEFRVCDWRKESVVSEKVVWVDIHKNDHRREWGAFRRNLGSTDSWWQRKVTLLSLQIGQLIGARYRFRQKAEDDQFRLNIP